MAKLKVDFDVLEETARVYNNEVQNFEEARDGVKQALDELKSSGWVSQAGSAWFDAVDMDWVETINFHIRVITELSKEIGIASKEYREIYNKQCELSKHLY